MTVRIDPPEANHPLTGIRRTGVVQDTVNAPITVNVFVGGDSSNLIPLPYVGMQPNVGDTVVIFFVGGDGIIIGSVLPNTMMHTGISYADTVASYSPSSGVNTKITDWQTVIFNVGDISYSAGVFTTLSQGGYTWKYTITWPATTASYRSLQGVFLNNAVTLRGEQSYQSSTASAGSITMTTTYTEQMAAGDTLQAFMNVSTAGVTGVLPRGFVITKEP